MDQYTYEGLAPEDKVEALRALAARAALAENGPRYCLSGEAVFFAEDSQARLAGHIYSHEGAREFNISGVCEYHFDTWMAEPDEDEPDQEPSPAEVERVTTGVLASLTPQDGETLQAYKARVALTAQVEQAFASGEG